MTTRDRVPATPGLSRRDLLVASAVLGCTPASGGPVHAATGNTATAPMIGDGFVQDGNSEAAGQRVTAAMLSNGGKPLAVLPCDPQTGAARSGSRFLKLMLVRVDPGELDAETSGVAADGVTLIANMPVSHRLRVVYDEPPPTPGDQAPTSVYLIGQSDGVYGIALVVRAKPPPKD